MYYKAMKEETAADYLKDIIYVKLQQKNSTVIACGRQDAEGIVSSSGAFIYAIKETKMRNNGRVTLQEITKEEYEEGVKNMNEYGIPNDLYLQIKQDHIDEITTEVAAYGMPKPAEISGGGYDIDE